MLMDSLLPILALLALLAGLAALIACFILYNKVRRYLSDYKSGHGFGSRRSTIRDEIIDVCDNSSRFANFIKQGPPKPESRSELSTEQRNMIEKSLQRALDEKVEKIRIDLEKQLENLKEASEVPQPHKAVSGEEEVPPAEPEKKYIYRYAEAYDTDNKTFYEVTTSPSADTIYEFKIEEDNPSKGTFQVFGKSIAKVLECRDFIEGCCDVSGSGNHDIVTINAGQLYMDGYIWRVEKKLAIRFD